MLKAGRRDLAAAVAGGRDAATTVSATLWIARRAGIGAFATGGLGGVHRGAAESFDVSTDLDELARADGCLVVCSGAKTILDLPATLEALETRGVLVVGYRTDTLPGFTALSSGLPLEHRVDDPGRAAAASSPPTGGSGLPGAVVLAQPVPEADAADAIELDGRPGRRTGRGRRACGIRGKALTPFLLGRIHERTGGASLRANVALIVANAGLAAGSPWPWPAADRMADARLDGASRGRPIAGSPFRLRRRELHAGGLGGRGGILGGRLRIGGWLVGRGFGGTADGGRVDDHGAEDGLDLLAEGGRGGPR